jgi:hypothetical protein
MLKRERKKEETVIIKLLKLFIHKIAFNSNPYIVTLGPPPAQQACQVLTRAEFATVKQREEDPKIFLN